MNNRPRPLVLVGIALAAGLIAGGIGLAFAAFFALVGWVF